MPVTHQLISSTTYQNTFNTSLKVDIPIAIIGIAESATFPVNTITRIQKDSDLTLLGGTTDNTILPEVRILQQDYGCNNIFVIRVAKGVDAAATEVNIIGTETVTKTGLGLFKDTFTTFRIQPELLLIPGLNSAAVVTKAIEVCNTNDSFVYLDFSLGTTFTTATTTRATTTGLGTKSARLIPCMPRLKRGANFESLATHTVGVLARSQFYRGFGFTASNETFISAIDGMESGFTLSYTDVNADNQKLENLGISTVNLSTMGFVVWGNRNALFVSGSNETLDTYSVVQTIRRKMNNEFLVISSRFLDEDSSYSTAKLLESALNNSISTNLIRANLKAGSRAVYNENLSDLNARKLVYDSWLAINLPIEVITITTQLSVQL